MSDGHGALLFFVAALAVAISPGPGMFYVAARTLAAGRREGIASTLGLVSVVLNTLGDVVVTFLASNVRASLIGRPLLIRRLREGSGMVLCGLGATLAVARRPA